MIAILLVNAAVSLIVGIALLLAWRRNAALRFSRNVGWAFVVQALAPLAFMLWTAAATPWRGIGAALLVTCAVAYLTLMVSGVAHLADRPLSRRAVVTLATALALVVGVALSQQARLAQAITSSAHLAVGVLAAMWLWRLGTAERLAGVLLVLLAVTHFGYAAFGDLALPAQASVAAVLRVALGMALLYAALNRSSAESRRLRDNLTRLTELSHQGVAVMRGEKMLYANPALLRIYGIDRIEDSPANWRDATIPDDDRARVRQRHQRLLSGELAHASWEGRRRRPDGKELQLRFSAWRIDWDGAPAEQLVVSDDTAHHDTLRSLLHRATHDELTGLPSRSALLQRLRELCGAEAPTSFALLLLDIDRFKLFNEGLDHSLGDQVLVMLARGLGDALAGQAEVMRLGEDEFALLAVAPDARARAEQLVAAVQEFARRPLELPTVPEASAGTQRFYVDLSIGVALHPQAATDPEALLRAANAAMHEAKRTPGTSVQFADERFERGSGNALAVEQALRAGWMGEEFSLAYQPKVDARSGALVGLEALARWDRPGHASIGPDEFIAAAERIGLIGALGAAILARACQQQAAWRAEGLRLLPVAVNVSPLQLLDPTFPEVVKRTLQRFALPAELLTLELTESAAVTHIEQTRAQIERLRANGVAVALDDFGAGFSSLKLLRGLPLEAVKIDRSLVEPLPAPDATAVIHAICELARVLGLDAIAEGVETPAQAAAAIDAGCGMLQGSFYSTPLAPADAARWLRAPLTASVRAAAAS